MKFHDKKKCTNASPPETKEKSEKLRVMSYWQNIVREAVSQTTIVAKFLCLLHVTSSYLCSPTLVYGPSMLPTLNLTGDVLLVEHVSRRLGKVEAGDIVLVRSPIDPRKIVTKRIVGMAGDIVSYLPDPSVTDASRTVVVPKGHIWIQGDNMYASRDSRHFGPVPFGLVQGRAFLRVWPLYSFGLLGQ
ncbi:uncharacterized protein LOC126670052 [Mercurialis annua]|uniref:uncharacterized protein LOC126670052 n=1 Tax=Mercurialis annua TaxID=3986 RepID=UPI00216069BA|nr:uncharacterized protein LOC126670052 [Mercurialis annua]XP_050219663.1 uncharacterized protein LOC126670052 [Mercurialis annua]